MAHVIAVAGKGGVGKTTLCGLLIQYLCESGKGPVLAVDADANSNLNEVLGVEVEATLGDIREEIARAEMASKNPIPAGMSKACLLYTSRRSSKEKQDQRGAGAVQHHPYSICRRARRCRRSSDQCNRGCHRAGCQNCRYRP